MVGVRTDVPQWTSNKPPLQISQSGIQLSKSPKYTKNVALTVCARYESLSEHVSFCMTICIILTTWKQKHLIWDPPIPFQHHPVLVHRNRAKGIAVGWSLDHTRYRQVVHSCVLIPAVSSVVFVSSHETHHTAVGAYDGQELVEVPSQTDGVCGLGVYRKVT